MNVKAKTRFTALERAHLTAAIHIHYSAKYRTAGYEAWCCQEKYGGSIYSNVQAVTGSGNNGSATSFIHGIQCLIDGRISSNGRALSVAFNSAIAAMKQLNISLELHEKITEFALELAAAINCLKSYVMTVSEERQQCNYAS